VSNSTLPNDIADLETLEEEQGGKELHSPIQTDIEKKEFLFKNGQTNFFFSPRRKS
jgi:hypothetical protein